MDRLEVTVIGFDENREAREILQLRACPESADVIDALAAIADPAGKAAERVRMCDPMHMIEYLNRKLVEGVAIPKKYLGVEGVPRLARP